MKLFLQPNNYSLVPVYPDDWENFNKLKKDLVYACTIKLERNYKFHKKFFALLRIGHENTKLQNISEDAYRDYITMKSGYYEIIKIDNKKIPVAKSIAFDKMDEAEFQVLFNKALTVVAVDIQATKEVIENELMGFIK